MFESAKLKLERADYHIADLGGQLQAFVLRKPHRFGVKNDSETGQPVIQIRFIEPIPNAFQLIIGDAIHNIRCALDHVLWEIIGIDGGTQNKHLMFSPRDDRSSFEGWVNGIQTPSSWVKDLLRGWEAFPRGRGHVLYILHDLDITDKHRAIRPVLRGTGHPPFTIFNSDGSVMVSFSGNIFIGGGDAFPIHPIPNGGWVEIADDANCSPDIYIPEIQGINAIGAIRALRAFVGAALDEGEKAVRANTAGVIES